MSTPSSYPLLAGVQAQAQADAERHFGDGPATPWQPRSQWPGLPPPRRAWRAAALRACVALALVAVAAGAAWWLLGAGSQSEPHSELATARDDDDVDAAAPALPPPAAPPTQAATPTPTLSVTRRAAEWRVEAVGVTRLAAAQRLAQASGSSIAGEMAPQAAGGLVNLRWQGRDLAGAWQAVLGAGVSFALQCGTARCRVWVAEAGVPGPAAPAPLQAAPAADDMAAVALAAPAAVSSDELAQARLSAHHD